MSQSEKKIITFDKLFWKLFLWFIFAIFIIVLLPFVFTRETFVSFDFSTSGEVGDTIGGIMGPAVAIVACAFTFLAFWIQYKANQILQSDVEKRENDLLLQKFENKYYELLKLHLTNIDQMELAGRYQNRKVFQKLFTEYKFTFEKILWYIQKKLNDNSEKYLGFKYNDEQRIAEIAYQIYFWGTGPNSDKILSNTLTNLCSADFAREIIQELYDVKNSYRKEIENRFAQNREGKKNWSEETIRKENYKVEVILHGTEREFTYRFYYTPFDGHSQRVGHYYRHLFQLVKYVADYDSKILSIDQKQEYIKTIRAQLSSYEQLLLYYNSLSGLGKAWNFKENNFIERFRLIKNIPLPLTDFGLSPREKYKVEINRLKDIGDKFFEWDE